MYHTGDRQKLQGDDIILNIKIMIGLINQSNDNFYSANIETNIKGACHK